MIVYRKSCSGLPLLLRAYGSALPRALFPALFSTVLAMIFEFTMPTELLESFFDHPYPFQVFAYIVSFALVFRTNIAHQRYWEMRSSVVVMSSKWGDGAAIALTFEEGSRAVAAEASRTPAADEVARSALNTIPPSAAPLVRGGTALPALELREALMDEEEDALSELRPAEAPLETAAETAARQSQALLVHRMSLMHALALQYLRRDNSLANLCDDASAPEDEHEGTHLEGANFEDGWCTSIFGDQDDPKRHDRFVYSQPLPVLGGLDRAEIPRDSLRFP